MPQMAWLRRALKIVMKVGAVLAFAAPLATRLVVGYTFFETGRGKIDNPAGVTAFFTELGIPFPELNAAFVARVEYYGGLALIVGLGARIAAIFLSGTMVVALLTADKAKLVEKWAESGLSGMTDVLPAVLLLLLVWLIFYGPGAASLDALVERGLRKWWEAAPEQPRAKNTESQGATAAADK